MHQADIEQPGGDSMAEVNKVYFDQLLARRNMSLRELARQMGKNHSQLSLTFAGERKMPLDEAAMMSEIFGEPIYRIAQNAGIDVRAVTARRAAVVGYLNGLGVIDIDVAEHHLRVPAPDDLPENPVAVQCRTARTALAWLDGWVAFCAAPRDIALDCIDRLCFCQIKDGPAVLTTVRRGYAPDTYNLFGLYSQDNVVLEWATPILKINP